MKLEDLSDHTKYVSGGPHDRALRRGYANSSCGYSLFVRKLGKGGSIYVCVHAPRRFFSCFEMNRGLAHLFPFFLVGWARGALNGVENWSSDGHLFMEPRVENAFLPV